MFYFYCPHCGAEEVVPRLPIGTVLNARDGSGVPIQHYKCNKCGNLDAGFMIEQRGDMSEKVLYRSIIGLYQNRRGFQT